MVSRRHKARKEGRRLEQKPDVAKGSIGRQVDKSVTFFITNFPEDFGAKEVPKIFQHYEKFSEVVIPAKRSRIGQRFGFALALGVENPIRLGVKLDNIFIDSARILSILQSMSAMRSKKGFEVLVGDHKLEAQVERWNRVIKRTMMMGKT